MAIGTTDLIGAVQRAVDPARLAAHLAYFAGVERTSGEPGEREAVEWMRRTLAADGIATEVREFAGYLSYPGAATLEILAPERLSVPVRTRSFGRPTPPEGLELDLVFVDVARRLERGAMIFSHRSNAAAYDAAGAPDPRGRVVVTPDGGPDGVRRAQERGAAAHIHVWTSDEPHIHEMIATPVWGTPTPENAVSLPGIPSLSVTQADGERLRALCAAGPVRARLTAEVETGWRPQPLLLAHIPGRSDHYLLVGAHIDSWYVGVTDNATGDAALLEMARVLHERRGALERGVVFAWWPGHSTGRYAGSTWFADQDFADLRARCVGYLNIDSPGCRGASVWDCRYTMGEAERFMEGLVREVTGQPANPRRPLKAGDQSFWGIGLTSLGAFRMLPPDHPNRKAVGGCGGGWWWHTPEDTLDKADVEVLRGDTALYAAIAARLAADPVLPYEFSTVARDFARRLTELDEEAGGSFDFGPAQEAVAAFDAAAGRLEAARQGIVEGGDAGERRALDAGILRLCRLLNPALYTTSGPYDHDPALQVPLLPGLGRAAELRDRDPASDAARFLHTRLVRGRNRVVDALQAATVEADRLMREVGR
ncbi:MAG: M28 family metallopeptidase [Chloroflexota bacterium]|nr:M28 family metallopeptidase [Chloroflexota bacterium]